MKILQVSQEVPPETAWGGIGTYIDVLTPALVQAGADVHVLSVVPGQTRSTVVRDDGVVVHREPLTRLPGIGRASGMPVSWERVSLARSVAREVERLRAEFVPDVVESPNWKAEGAVLARRHAFPIAVRLHSWAAQVYAHLEPRAADLRLAAYLEEQLVRRADVVFATRVQIEDAGPRLGLDPDALRVIAPPVPDAPVTAFPEAPPTVLFVGRLEPRKRPETIVRAMPEVAARVPGARAILVGGDASGPGVPSYATWLRGLARELGVAASVEVRDDRPGDAEVAQLRQRSWACVMPSRWESFGYVAAEGLAAGRPVVATDVGGLREVIDDGATGYLVAADDPAAWATALARVLEDPVRAAAMGAEGARRVRRRYGPAATAALTVDAYEHAILRHQARASQRAALPSWPLRSGNTPTERPRTEVQ